MRQRWMVAVGAVLLAAQVATAAATAPASARGGVRPVVLAEQLARITVGRGMLHIDTTLDYTVRQGKVSDLSVALPADATVVSLKGEGVRSWATLSHGAQRLLKVQLMGEMSGRVALWLRLQQPIPRGALGQPMPFTVPAVVPQDVARETGVVALLAEPGLKVEAAKAVGATEIDLKNLPEALQGIENNVRLAYSYKRRPFAIRAQVTEVEAAAVMPWQVEPEPPRLLVHEATATGTVGETVAKIAVKLGFEATGNRPPERLLLPPSVSLTSVRFGDAKRGARLVRDEQGYVLRAEAEGVYTLDLEFVVRVEKKDKTRSLTLPLVPAAMTSTSLTIPGASVAVKLSPEIGYETAAKGSDTTLTVYGAVADKVTVSWEPKVELKDVTAIVFADQSAKLTVGRGVLRVDTTFDYSILQGKVKDLTVALPADATLLSVKGEGIRNWDVTTQGTARALKVQLLDETADRYTLELQLEQPIGKGGLAGAATFTVPAIAAQGVERETGAVGILVWKGLKVEPVKTQGVTQVDVREMPAAFQKLSDQVHLAYRYLQRPFAIEARVSEVEAKVSADVLTAVRVSPEALRFSSTINYLIKDAGVFRFRIKLGKDVKLVDLQGENINNWEREADTLVIDLRSKAEGPYALTLEAEQAIPQGTAEVDVVGVELLDVARERGYLALSAYPGIKVEAKKAENIMQVDVRDLPSGGMPIQRRGQARQAGPAPAADLAFRYLKHPYTLRIAISKVEAEVAATVHTTMNVSEKNIEVAATLQYAIRKAGIFQLQVALPQGFRLLGCDGPNIDDWKVADGKLTVALKQKTEGAYTLTLTGKSDVAKLAELPILVFKALDAEKETGFVAVVADESLRVKTAKTEGLAEIDVKELPAELQKGKVLLAYKYFAHPWSGTLAAEPIEPHVTAETFTFLSLGEALIQASATVRYTILYAGVQTFRVQLPEGAANVDITGPDIKHREEDKENHIWTITLQAKKKADYSLFVTFQQEVGGEAVDLKFAGLHVLDVKRETGYIAVAARSDLELSAGDKLEGLTPIDPQEIPAHYKSGITAPLLLAFRYLRHPYSLHANAVRHDPAGVLVAIIEGCLLSTTLTEDGNLITDVTCRLRNTREQNLAVALPKGAELWHVFVDGKRAIPVQSKEGDTLWTKVPIAGVGGGTRPFVVQLRYGHTLDRLGGCGVLRLEFPRLAIPAMRLGWRVSLPEKYNLVSHAGSLRYVARLDGELQALAGIVAPVEQTRKPVAVAKGQGLQYDYNRAAMDNLQQEASSVRKGRAGGQRSIYTGAKPETRNVYHFQSLIAMKQAGSIRSVYLRRSMDRVVQGALVVVVFVVVFAFWRACGQRSRSWRLGVIVAVALVALGVRTLSEDAYHQQLTDILWTLIGASVVMLVWDGVRGVAAPKQEKDSDEKPSPPPEPKGADQAPAEVSVVEEPEETRQPEAGGETTPPEAEGGPRNDTPSE